MIYLLFLSFPLLHLFETLNNLLLLVPGLVNSYKNLKSKIFAAIQVFCVVWSMVLETSDQDTPDTLPVAAHIYTHLDGAGANHLPGVVFLVLLI